MLKYEIQGNIYSSESVEDSSDRWCPCKTFYYDSTGELIFIAEGWKGAQDDRKLLELWEKSRFGIPDPIEGYIKKFTYVDKHGIRTDRKIL